MDQENSTPTRRAVDNVKAAANAVKNTLSASVNMDGGLEEAETDLLALIVDLLPNVTQPSDRRVVRSQLRGFIDFGGDPFALREFDGGDAVGAGPALSSEARDAIVVTLRVLKEQLAYRSKWMGEFANLLEAAEGALRVARLSVVEQSQQDELKEILADLDRVRGESSDLAQFRDTQTSAHLDDGAAANDNLLPMRPRMIH